MFFIMAVNLYTSRVVLDTLGVDDFGIYNVVGGIVAMFTAISGALASAISRFITIELGCNNLERLKIVFSTSVTIQIVLALILFLFAEIGGVWFLNTQMNIPENRMIAANWVLQCSILTFMINLVSIPYNAAIIAHEHMKAFAYISILEVFLKLGIVFLLYILLFDKLVAYVVLLVLVAVITRFAYGLYCKMYFDECSYCFVYDKELLQKMTRFAGWNFLGNSTYVFNTQGVNILINLFFGVVVNAARGIASQVDIAIMQFVNSFTTAINPQITKAYATNDMDYLFQLVCRGAKYSYFLILFFAVPFILETDVILTLWLKNVPEYTAVFVRLAIIASISNVMGNTMMTSALATGDVKKYFILVTGAGCLVFPLTYIFFRFGFPPEITYIIFIIIYMLLIFLRLYILKGLIDFPIMRFMKEVLYRIIPVTVFAFIIPVLIFSSFPPSIYRFLLVGLASVCSTLSTIYLLGLEDSEKCFVNRKVKSFCNFK